ncbi:MAG: sigma-70 family RNA polymerase sigma factor [bacterium]|nr:sigma-70 family RNA polymerase sigma factor [bacterium]
MRDTYPADNTGKVAIRKGFFLQLFWAAMFTTVSELISRLPSADDDEAWEVFNAQYSPMLKRFFSGFGTSGDLARDMTQDTIEKAVNGLRSGAYLRDRGRLRDWMSGIAKNVLREHWRKAQRGGGGPVQAKTMFWESCTDPTAEGAMRAADDRFDELWVRARLAALIRHALGSFSRRDLRCYFLIEVHRRPIAQVAQRLGMSVSAVYNRRRAVASWFRAVGPRFISQWEK